jgi:Holliday junction resolvase
LSGRQRGFNAERELARLLWSKGFAVIRAPASGARARHLIYPDIVALYHGRVFAIEVKYHRTDVVYVQASQVEKLLEFSSRAGATPLIAVKRPRRGWYIVPLEAAKKTSNGIRIDNEVLNKSYTLEEFISSIVNKPLTHFTNPGRDREEGEKEGGSGG